MDYLNLLVDTKKEFSLLLILDLHQEINKGIFSIYNHCKLQLDENKMNTLLPIFQKMLSEIPNWNNQIIQSETNRIKKSIPHIEDLLTAVFISNMRLLCSVKNNQKKIKVKIPKIDVFIHKCYIYTARELWQTVYLFSETKDKLKKQENNKKIEEIIIRSIENVIRKLLPIKTILNDYLETNLTETTEAEIDNSLINIINDNQNNNEDSKKTLSKDTTSINQTNNTDSQEKNNTLKNNHETNSIDSIDSIDNQKNNDKPNLITNTQENYPQDNNISEDNNIPEDNNFFNNIIDTPNILYDNNKVIKLNT
tara:strand:+ start:420 stop:1346 length:927 start_codon:yes stop_codon:yes gene_type:complete